MSTLSVLAEIQQERIRQQRLRDAGRFKYTLADVPGPDDGFKLACVLEELAEVGKCILGRDVQDGDGDMRTELIHVAALSVAWIEAIDILSELPMGHPEHPENPENRAWAVLDWLAENNPAALELCPYKVVR